MTEGFFMMCRKVEIMQTYTIYNVALNKIRTSYFYKIAAEKMRFGGGKRRIY